MTEKILNVSEEEVEWEHDMQSKKMSMIHQLMEAFQKQTAVLEEIRDLLKEKK